jgi:hypothetical protein
MNISPIATFALVIAFAALVFAGGASGEFLPLLIGVAAATIFVALAAVFKAGSGMSRAAARIPLEDFTIWSDVGEPMAELKRLTSNDKIAAIRIVDADLGSLTLNAELIHQRLLLLAEKPDFKDLSQLKLDLQTNSLIRELQKILTQLGSGKEHSADDLKLAAQSIEGCASQADRIANKFYDFVRGKQEIIRIYIEPLRRAAENLSRDLRLASVNLRKYVEALQGQPVVSAE